MATYVLGQYTFPSKAAAKQAVSKILRATPLGHPLPPADAALVAALLAEGRHPEAAEKIGSGIASIIVRPASYNQRCFWLRRTDGTEVDFSYLVALNGAPSPKTAAVWALREEVDDQIAAFRERQAATVLCELCGEPALASEAHVDHAEPTFDALATRFAEVLGGWAVLGVECQGPYGRRLADRGHAEVWCAYHQQTARLRLVHPRCNLTRRGA